MPTPKQALGFCGSRDESPCASEKGKQGHHDGRCRQHAGSQSKANADRPKNRAAAGLSYGVHLADRREDSGAVFRVNVSVNPRALNSVSDLAQGMEGNVGCHDPDERVRKREREDGCSRQSGDMR